MKNFTIEIDQDSDIRMLHSDEVDLGFLQGEQTIWRASNVEFCNTKQRWYVQSAKTEAILRDDFLTRQQALDWEREYYSPGGPGWGEVI